MLRRLLLLFLFPMLVSAEPISLDLQAASLPDTLHLLAKFLHINMVISPAVQGVTTLHLQEAEPAHALELLLTSQHLAKWRMGDVWYIAPREELIKHKQDEIKWRELEDASLPLITATWQIRYARARDIADLLQDEHAAFISKRGRVRVDARTNVLCVQDVAGNIETVRRLIAELDVPVQQILIKARLASVDHDVERELGVQFAINQANGDDQGDGAIKQFGRTAGRYSVAVAKLADGSLLDVKLSALEHAGRAELISSPTLFTANQQPASIEAGEEVPYQEVSEGGGTAVVFKKAVLGLQVTPQVLPGGKVLLQLQINQDRPSNKMVQGVPTISTRQIKTSVLVAAGQTIVLGGIYETGDERGEERIPFLSRIPVLGALFKQVTTRSSKRELLIFVTPKIITP